MLHFCAAETVEDGVLLFNLLTREMVLLSQEEYDGRLDNAYLKDRWFVVPENTNEKAYADFVRTFLKRQEKHDGIITSYTIFPTTDCNARCFYCFELGRSRIPMSPETAEKVVQYIKNHCGGKNVHLAWFGGEPLYNSEAIDIICNGLRQENVVFDSFMVSNGYLFTEEIIQKAVECWNLKKIQITLDGTEKVYNKIKAYIYRDVNPYQVVVGNIGKLLDASVQISIRLNMDLANAENLVELVDELTQRYGGRKGIVVYAHHLFKNDMALADTYSAEEWVEREKAMARLEQKIELGGLLRNNIITSQIKTNYCMADSGKNITILPDGNIGLCEHHTEDEFIGHIDREGFDQNVVDSWKKQIAQIPECQECFYYPECRTLQKCSNDSVCFLQYRQNRRRNMQQRMVATYQVWKNKEIVEVAEQEIC